ncbi:unnamed protein product, partial [Ranitomeya imitator]
MKKNANSGQYTEVLGTCGSNAAKVWTKGGKDYFLGPVEIGSNLGSPGQLFNHSVLRAALDRAADFEVSLIESADESAKKAAAPLIMGIDSIILCLDTPSFSCFSKLSIQIIKDLEVHAAAIAGRGSTTPMVDLTAFTRASTSSNGKQWRPPLSESEEEEEPCLSEASPSGLEESEHGEENTREVEMLCAGMSGMVKRMENAREVEMLCAGMSGMVKRMENAREVEILCAGMSGMVKRMENAREVEILCDGMSGMVKRMENAREVEILCDGMSGMVKRMENAREVEMLCAGMSGMVKRMENARE